MKRRTLIAASCIALLTTSHAPAEATFPGGSGKIVFESWDPETENYQIYVVNPDGSEATRLTKFTEGRGAVWPTLTPDGKTITFTAMQDGNWDLYVMNLDGSNVRKLFESPAREVRSTWSPDGRRIAFVRKVRGIFHIFVRNIATGKERKLTSGYDSGLFTLDWSPTGERIAYTKPRKRGILEILTIRPDGSGIRHVTHGGYASRLSWSPDGKWLVFGSNRRVANSAQIYTCYPPLPPVPGVTYGPCNYDIYVIRANGRDERQLSGVGVARPAYEDNPIWSPDGSKILFVSDRDGGFYETDLYVMDADGNNAQRILVTPGYDNTSSWQATSP